MCVCSELFCFLFKQKTAYDVRISDWSSDVCSSDLAPGRRADDLAGLRDQVVEPDLLVLVGKREVGVVASGGLAQRFPGLHRDLSVRLRRQGQDRLDCVNVRQDARLALRDALIEDGSVEASEKLDGLSHAPVDAFASVAELLQQGAERGELLVGVGEIGRA